MQTFDLILLAIIAAFAVAGFWFGLIHSVGSLLGTVLGAYLASRYYATGAAWLMGFTGWEGNIVKVGMFIVAFILITRLVGLAFSLLEKVVNIVKIIPFAGTANRLFGALLGALEGLLSIGLIIYFIERFPLSEKIMNLMEDSAIAPIVSKISNIFIPLLPDAFNLLKSTVDYAEGILL